MAVAKPEQPDCTAELPSYCVGVLKAAILSLIQDVEASALVVCTVGPTGNLMDRSLAVRINSKIKTREA